MAALVEAELRQAPAFREQFFDPIAADGGASEVEVLQALAAVGQFLQAGVPYPRAAIASERPEQRTELPERGEHLVVRGVPTRAESFEQRAATGSHYMVLASTSGTLASYR